MASLKTLFRKLKKLWSHDESLIPVYMWAGVILNIGFVIVLLGMGGGPLWAWGILIFLNLEIAATIWDLTKPK